jgi:hypothetical protein
VSTYDAGHFSHHAEGADETNEYGVDGVHDALLANGEVFSYHSSADNSDEAEMLSFGREAESSREFGFE